MGHHPVDRVAAEAALAVPEDEVAAARLAAGRVGSDVIVLGCSHDRTVARVRGADDVDDDRPSAAPMGSRTDIC